MDSKSAGLSASTISGGQKLVIHQNIPSDAIKRGPHAIVRAAQLNDCIEIQRRCGEGSKPLFDRDDIAVNQATIDGRDTNTSWEPNSTDKSNTYRKNTSTESSSPERYRHRDVKKRSSPISGRRKTPERSSRNERQTYNRDKHSYNTKYSSSAKTDKSRGKKKTRSPSPSSAKKKPVEKLPYYRDEQREKDRLKRLYGRSRSRSPPPSNSARRYSPPPRRRVESPPRRRRSISRDRYRKYSPPPSRRSRRDYNRARRSRSRSRTNSPTRRERHKHFSRSSKEQKEEANAALVTAVAQPTPQFIPIPIAVPADYAAYPFPTWPAPQPPWHPTQHRPPTTSHFTPIPMLSMMTPLRPPPQPSYPGMTAPMPYVPMTAPPYRPHIRQRYPPPRHNSNNYQARAKNPTN